MHDSDAFLATLVAIDEAKAVRDADDALRVAIVAYAAARDALEVAQAADEAAFEAYLVAARALEARDA